MYCINTFAVTDILSHQLPYIEGCHWPLLIVQYI